ncbi:MAG: hypothetical protein SGJ13_12460 [Actinomycetota bacterium]|nr:hypothetical protein [Actinomycetota bacterium]
MTPAQELALLAMKPGQDKHRLGTRAELNACLAGLLVAHAVLDGRAKLTAKGVVPGAADPPNAVDDIIKEKGPKLKAVLSHMSRGLQHETGKGTWDYVTTDLDAKDIRTRVVLVDRYRAAAAGTHDLDPEIALVLACTGPAHLLEIVAPDRKTRGHARDRIDHALDGTNLEPVIKTITQLIADNETAVVVA